MANKVRGSAVVQGPTGHSWSPSNGFIYAPTWEGTPAASLGVLAAYRAAGIPYSMSSDGAWVKITAQQPTDGEENEVPQGKWDLSGTDCDRDIADVYSLWNFTEAEFDTLNKLRKGEISLKPSESGLTLDALGFYTLLFKGQNTVKRTQWVLKHSLTTSQAWETELVGSNLGLIYTTAQLLSECAAFDIPLPALYVNNIELIPAPTPQDAGYVWGWMKKSFNTGSATFDKVETSVEYHYDLWNIDLLYDEVPA